MYVGDECEICGRQYENPLGYSSRCDDCEDTVFMAIVGSRDITDIMFVEKAVEESGYVPHTIVSGGARGVDTLAEQYAKEHGLAFLLHPAEWDRYGRSAGYKRNVLIVNDSEVIVAVKRPESTGTQHTIDIANERGVPVHILVVP